MQDEKKSKEGAYASLTGFHRAVPIILFAMAIFIALCYFTKDHTGAFGKVVAGFLLGSFSIGGYFIPVLFAVHAFFYASDIQHKRLISRIIFSFLLLFLSFSCCTDSLSPRSLICKMGIMKSYRVVVRIKKTVL